MNDRYMYMEAVLRLFGEKVDKLTEGNREELGEALLNSLLDLDGPKQVDAKPDGETTFLARLFNGLSEINGSYESLRDAEIYIRRFPFSDTRVTRDRYLKYIIENHLHETYILKERLLKYLKTVERLYKPDEQMDSIKKGTSPLYKLVSQSLKRLTTQRNFHVHNSRIVSKNIDRIASIDLITPGLENDWLTSYARWQFREVRKQHKKQIEAINDEIEDLLGVYFSKLYSLVFYESGCPRYPMTK